MKIQLDSGPIRTMDGEELREGRLGDGPVITFRRAACQGLLAPAPPGEPDANMAEKERRFKLSRKIHRAGESVNLTSDEVTLIKECVAKAYSALVVGQFNERIENGGVDPDNGDAQNMSENRPE